ESVTGTVVTLQAATDRPLRRAWIEYVPEIQDTPRAMFLAPLGSATPFGVAASVAMGRTVYQPIPAKLGPDQRRFSVTFQPALHGSYTIYFEDENELVNSRTYELRLRPDPAPLVRLERPSLARDMLSTVLPTAELPLPVIAADVQFALRSVRLEYGPRPEGAPRVQVLYSHERGLARDIAPWTGFGIFTLPRPRLRPQRLEFHRTLPLKAIRHANGAPLKEGDVVILQACA